MRETRLPPGRQPYDGLNGMRVGALAGVIIGILPATIFDTRAFWWILAAAIFGGLVGYLFETRAMRRDLDR